MMKRFNVLNKWLKAHIEFYMEMNNICEFIFVQNLLEGLSYAKNLSGKSTWEHGRE